MTATQILNHLKDLNKHIQFFIDNNNNDDSKQEISKQFILTNLRVYLEQYGDKILAGFITFESFEEAIMSLKSETLAEKDVKNFR